MTNGYNFYFKDGEDVLTFPITPSKLSVKIGSNNKVVTLIGEGEINILKSPSLIEVEFEARFPMRQYPYAREYVSFETYYHRFAGLKEEKRPFRFIVARTKPNGDRTWDTNLLMALEDFNLTEDSNEGDDVLISFKLKQFKEYGVKRFYNDLDSTSTSTVARPSESSPSSKDTVHVIASGESLWSISKLYYGTTLNWKKIYEANKNAIEEDAKKHGKASSSNGQWLWSGLEILIPAL